jgi:hypothetical protein
MSGDKNNKHEWVEQTGWLLERGATEYIGVIEGFLQWTSDPNKALRLCRREDADALAELVDDCEKISEHMWCGPSQLQGTRPDELTAKRTK